MEIKNNLKAAQPGVPELHDRGDGVSGHYCIGRLIKRDGPYFEFWNNGVWCSAGEIYVGEYRAGVQRDLIDAYETLQATKSAASAAVSIDAPASSFPTSPESSLAAQASVQDGPPERIWVNFENGEINDRLKVPYSVWDTDVEYVRANTRATQEVASVQNNVIQLVERVKSEFSKHLNKSENIVVSAFVMGVVSAIRLATQEVPQVRGYDSVVFPHRMVSLEGRLELEHVPSDCDTHKPFLVGLAVRENGAANVANVERDLFALNGKAVRVTIEWRDSDDNSYQQQEKTQELVPQPQLKELSEEAAERAYDQGLLYVAPDALGPTRETVIAISSIISEVFAPHFQASQAWDKAFKIVCDYDGLPAAFFNKKYNVDFDTPGIHALLAALEAAKHKAENQEDVK